MGNVGNSSPRSQTTFHAIAESTEATLAMLTSHPDWQTRECLLPLPPTDIFMHATPLVIAAALGKLESIRLLVERGVDTHVDDDKALRIAAENGHLDVVRFLVEHDADVHAQEDYALRLSAANGHLDVVRFLVEHDADVHAQEDEALRASAANGHLDVVRFLVEHDADVHAQEDYALRRSKVRPSWPRAQDAGRPSAC